MRRLTLLASVLLLAGCQTPLMKLHTLDPQANDFHSALAAEYMAYADSEAEQGNKKDAKHFAAKGLAAMNGETVDPEVPRADQEALLTARGELVSVLTNDIKRVAPQKAARAQLLFDCWQQQVTHAERELAPCADEFQSALAELQTVAEWFVHGRETTHALYFAPKSAALNGEAEAQVADVAEHLLCIANYTIELRGNAGPRKSARALLGKRHAAIRGALMKKGVPAKHIKLKRDNNSKVVFLSSDVIQDANQVDIVVRTFGWFGEKE